jgi:O-antigen/teichoic acid export membrane protein
VLKNQVKLISKDTLIYGLGSTVGGIVGFLLLPLYTHYLTPSDYGYLAIFVVVQALVQTIATFGLAGGLIRYYLMANDEQEKKTVLSTILWSQVLIVVLMAVLLIPFRSIFSTFLFCTPTLAFLLVITSLTAFTGAFNNIPFSLMRAERKPVFFAISQVGKTLLLATANIYLIVVLKLNFRGVIYGAFCAEFIIALFVGSWYLTRFKNYISLIFSLPFFSRLIKLTGPVFVSNIFLFSLNLSDRFFLNHFLPPAEVGIYFFGFTIASIIQIGLIIPFSVAFLPFSISLATNQGFREIFPKIVKYFVIICTSLSIVLFYFSKEVIMLISTPLYYRSANVVGLLLISGIFAGLYYSTSIPLTIIEKTKLVTIGVFLAATINVILNLVLIPHMGIYGSALSSCISYGVFFGVTFYFSQKNYPVQYEISSFLKFCLITLIYAGIYFPLNLLSLSFWLNIIIKSCLISVLPVFLYLSGVLDINERKYLRSLFLTIKE